MKHLVMQVHERIVVTLCMVRWSNLVIAVLMKIVFYTRKVHVQQVPNQRWSAHRKNGSLNHITHGSNKKGSLTFQLKESIYFVKHFH